MASSKRPTRVPSALASFDSEREAAVASSTSAALAWVIRSMSETTVST
jgi:hypothetical protein